MFGTLGKSTGGSTTSTVKSRRRKVRECKRRPGPRRKRGSLISQIRGGFRWKQRRPTLKPAAPSERHDPQLREPQISECSNELAGQIGRVLLKRIHLINGDAPLFDPFDFYDLSMCSCVCLQHIRSSNKSCIALRRLLCRGLFDAHFGATDEAFQFDRLVVPAANCLEHFSADICT